MQQGRARTSPPGLVPCPPPCAKPRHSWEAGPAAASAPGAGRSLVALWLGPYPAGLHTSDFRLVPALGPLSVGTHCCGQWGQPRERLPVRPKGLVWRILLLIEGAGGRGVTPSPPLAALNVVSVHHEGQARPAAEMRPYERARPSSRNVAGLRPCQPPPAWASLCSSSGRPPCAETRSVSVTGPRGSCRPHLVWVLW